MNDFEYNVLVPLKIKSDKQFQLFSKCWDSYRHIVYDQRAKVIIANDSNEHFTKKLTQKINESKCDAWVTQGGGFVNSVRNLIKAADRDFLLWFLDDVELLETKRNIVEPCIKSMLQDESIIQIKFGSGKVARKSIQTNISALGNLYQPTEIDNDIIWTCDIKNDDEKYIFSQWNAVMRTNAAKQMDHLIKGNFETWDAYTVAISDNTRTLTKNYKTGWLNFRDYLYPHGRSTITLEKAKSMLQDKM